MRDGFSRFRGRILRALDAAEPVGLDDRLLLRVLDVGRRRPNEKHLAGALAYLARAHLVTRARDPDAASSASRLTNRGAFLVAALTSRGRRPSSPAPAAPPRLER